MIKESQDGIGKESDGGGKGEKESSQDNVMNSP